MTETRRYILGLALKFPTGSGRDAHKGRDGAGAREWPPSYVNFFEVLSPNLFFEVLSLNLDLTFVLPGSRQIVGDREILRAAPAGLQP
jgi:hypothetical protein